MRKHPTQMTNEKLYKKLWSFFVVDWRGSSSRGSKTPGLEVICQQSRPDAVLINWKEEGLLKTRNKTKQTFARSWRHPWLEFNRNVLLLRLNYRRDNGPNYFRRKTPKISGYKFWGEFFFFTRFFWNKSDDFDGDAIMFKAQVVLLRCQSTSEQSSEL